MVRSNHRFWQTSLPALHHLRVEAYSGIFALLMGGEYVAAVPARGRLSFCDASDAKGIEELYALIGRIAEGVTTA